MPAFQLRISIRLSLLLIKTLLAYICITEITMSRCVIFGLLHCTLALYLVVSTYDPEVKTAAQREQQNIVDLYNKISFKSFYEPQGTKI